MGGDRLGEAGNSSKDPATQYPTGRSSSGPWHSHWVLGCYRPDGCSPRYPREHASWPTIPVFPDCPEHPDGRYPSFQVRCHSWADALLLATLAVMSGINRCTGIEQRDQVQVDGQSSEIAAVPKPPSPSALTCRTLSIDALAYRKWVAQTSRAPGADHVPARTGNRQFPQKTVSGTLAVEQVTGCEGCEHKTATIARTLQEPRACRNASTGPPKHRMAAGTGSRRDQAQPAQPGCAPAEQRRRSKSNGNPLPPFPPVCESDSLAMINGLSDR